jgi:archaetidylinositol phosphate synthase
MKYTKFSEEWNNNMYDANTFFHKYFSMSLAKYLAFIFINIKLSPNIITLLSSILVVSSVLALNIIQGLLGACLLLVLSQLSYSFDCADGVIARISGRESSFGAFLDASLDRFNIIVYYGGIYYYMVDQKLITKDYEIQIVGFSVLLYFLYQTAVNLQAFYFPSLKKYMRENEFESLMSKIVKIIYEFIDTGIMYAITSTSLIFNLLYPTIVIYGVISLLLIIGLYWLLYKHGH